MKIGTEDKKKTRMAIVLGVLAVLVALYEFWPSGSPPETTAANVSQQSAPSTEKGKRGAVVFSKLDPTLRVDLLKGSEEVSYTGSGRDIFHSQAAPPAEIPKVDTNPIVTVPVKQAPPPPPPIPLKFYGFASANNKKQIFLANGDDVFVAREGDIVKGRYKIVRVNPNNVEVQDVLANHSQSLPLTMPSST